MVWLLGPGAKWWLVHIDGVEAGEGGLTGKDLAAAVDAVRGRALALGTALLALVAIFYTATNAASARQSANAALKNVQTNEAAQLRMHELTEQGQRNDRFTAAVSQLGDPTPAIRLGGVHALAGLADDAPTREFRQTCIDVLCAYLRLPYDPDPGYEPAEGQDPAEHTAARATYRAFREVRHTIIRLIGNHLRDGAPVSWQGHDLDFTEVVFDGGDLHEAVFSGTTLFSGATFASGFFDLRGASFTSDHVNFMAVLFEGGTVNFATACFEGRWVSFRNAHFSGCQVNFRRAQFAGKVIHFEETQFVGSTVDFGQARFAEGEISFVDAQFIGGTVTFEQVDGSRPRGLPDWIAPEWS